MLIEYRWADGRYDRLPLLASELVRFPVAVLVATGANVALAAKAATSTVPIVFNTGGDPVRFGLVASLNRPGGNVTGVASLGKMVVAKRFELLRELVPQADAIAFLVNPNNAFTEFDIGDAQAAAAALGQKLIVVKVAVKAISTRPSLPLPNNGLAGCCSNKILPAKPARSTRRPGGALRTSSNL